MTRLLIALLAIGTPTRAMAEEPIPLPSAPTARFVLEDGWVSVRLERDSQPVPNGKLKVLVDSLLWAEGEMGDVGRGTFPRPKGPFCQVVFDLGNGPAAPVPLNFLPDNTLIPTEAVVRDGTAECCQIPRSHISSTPESMQNFANFLWLTVIIVGLSTAAVAGLLYWLYRRVSNNNAHNLEKRK